MDFSSQLFILIAVILSTFLSWHRGWSVFPRRRQDKNELDAITEKAASNSNSRDLVKRMEQLGTRCIVFYGSETGTAEEYAKRLAQEGKSRYGLETLLADPSDFDFDNLDQVPNNKAVIFVLATAGEGEPTENSTELFNFITAKGAEFSKDRNPPLENLRFAAFGLGNTTYEHYNAVIRKTTSALMELGARRVGDMGEGDDGAGTVEEDFLEWKESMWSALSLEMSLEKLDAMDDQPSSTFTTRHDLTKESPDVFLGELSTEHLHGDFCGPPSKGNPHLAPVSKASELFSTPERNCIHMEIDVSGYSGCGQNYQTGDHVAIWPTNSTHEVDAFLRILDLLERRDEVISLSGVDGSAQAPFPTPTTYDTIARYYLEIAGPVSRDHVARLASFAPTDKARQFMTKLGGDRGHFANQVTKRCLSLAMILHEASEGQPWTAISFAIIVEGTRKLAPRYYSISSSSLEQPEALSMTVVVESREIPMRGQRFHGVATNYLLNMERFHHTGSLQAMPGQSPYHDIMGPRNKYEGLKVPLYIRRSTFRLPADVTRPVIMVGPGTGVAPFRGFIRERMKQKESGLAVGKMILFLGCRSRDDDFVYKEEWQVCHIGCIRSYNMRFSNMGLQLTLNRIFKREWVASLKW